MSDDRGPDREPGPAAVCPHCHATLEPSPNAPGEVFCQACGSSFRSDKDRTLAWGAEKLPVLGRFELREVVGRGAFGVVYRAFDTTLDREVALKVPRAGSLGREADEARFVREARNAAQLRHPGIVPVFEVGTSGETSYIVSELVHGITLVDALTGRPFSFRDSAALVSRVARAVDHAHQQGIVHRDLKPANIMLGADGAPRVMDFGLARRDTGETTVTLEGDLVGTPAYMSPEQAAGQAHRVDRRSDVYSVGVILYELLTGELPFRGNVRMLVHQVLSAEPPRPSSLNDGIPRDLETICLRAMAKEPGDRYASAGAVADDLDRWLADEPIAARPPSAFERLLRWCRRDERVRDAGLFGTLMCVLGLVFLVTWLVYYWATGVEVTRRSEFIWQTAVVNALLLIGAALGRLVMRRSLAAMFAFLIADASVLIAIVASLGDWLPPGWRFRAGGVYDDPMVRVTLFAIFLSMGLLAGVLMVAAIVAQRRNLHEPRPASRSRASAAEDQRTRRADAD